MKTKDDSELIWGAENIGAEINRSERQTFHLLEKGLLPARKVGRSWVAQRGSLRASLVAEIAGQQEGA